MINTKFRSVSAGDGGIFPRGAVWLWSLSLYLSMFQNYKQCVRWVWFLLLKQSFLALSTRVKVGSQVKQHYRTKKNPSNCSCVMESPIFFTFFIISLFFLLLMWTLIGWTFTFPNSCISNPVSQSFPNFYTLKTPKLTQIWSLIDQSASTDKIRLDPWQKNSQKVSQLCVTYTCDSIHHIVGNNLSYFTLSE